MYKPLRKIIHAVAKEWAVATSEFYRKRSENALRSEIHRRALVDSVDVIEKDMPQAMFCKNKYEHLTMAAGLMPETGAVLEFGVYRGLTINHLADKLPDRRIYGFDSFRGLPEEWTGFRYSTANFDRHGRKPEVRSNVELVEGWFDKSLPPFLEKLNEPLALVHVDCDIYSSTVTVLELLEPFLKGGVIIVFDEFFNYPQFREHEYKAFYEFIERTGKKFEFVGYSGHQASVKLFD